MTAAEEYQNTVASWVDRAIPAIHEERARGRAESLWRTLAPNGLDLLIGEHIADLGGLRAMLSSTTPDEWRSVAELLQSLLEREPLSKGATYSGERIILGMFASELMSYVGSAERSHDT